MLEIKDVKLIVWIESIPLGEGSFMRAAVRGVFTCLAKTRKESWGNTPPLRAPQLRDWGGQLMKNTPTDLLLDGPGLELSLDNARRQPAELNI